MESQVSNSWYCTAILNFIMVIAGLSVSIPLTSLNPVTPVIKRIYNQTFVTRTGEPMTEDAWTPLLSFTMSMPFIGGFASSLSVKLLMSRFTRKQLLIATHIVTIIGHVVIAIGVGVSGSYEAFIIGRTIIGLSIGVGLNLYPIIVNETCSPRQRPLYAGMLGTWYVTGALVGVLIGWPKVFGSDGLWMGVLFFTIALSVIYLICAYWITDTPFQILMREGPERAAEVLRKLRTGKDSDVNAEMKALSNGDAGSGDVLVEETKTPEVSQATFLEVIKTPSYRRHFFGVVIVYSFVTACGLSNILFFSDSIFLNAGVDTETATIGTIGVFAIGPVVSTAGVFVLKRMDARTLILIGAAILIVGDAFMTASLATYENIPAMSYASIVAMCIYFFGFSLVNLTAYVIIAAISIDKTRPVCMTFATLGFWFFGWFVGFISPYLNAWMGPYAFLVWMAVTIAIGTYIIFFVPNTAGKSEEEIQMYFSDTEKSLLRRMKG